MRRISEETFVDGNLVGGGTVEAVRVRSARLRVNPGSRPDYLRVPW